MGRHIIRKWKFNNISNLAICEVSTDIPVDTVFKDSVVYKYDAVSKKAYYKPKTHYIKTVFRFRTYIIEENTKTRLVYSTDLREGLLNYMIGKRESEIIREDIPMGYVVPDTNAILAVIN